MKPSPNRSPLLTNAVSKLTPDVFSHPAWIRFGRKDIPQALDTVVDLFTTIKTLQKDDPAAACQVLLICAVYQNLAGQWFNALRTTKQALTLSRSSNLSKEVIWSLWGASAILIQHKDYEQACTQLVDLQAALNEQNEWVLAGFINVFRQTFSQPGMDYAGEHPQSEQESPFEDTIAFTFNWLLQWGFWSQGFETEFGTDPGLSPNDAQRHTAVSQSFFPIQRWQGGWHTLLLAIRGELRLQWKESGLPSRKRELSFWGSLLGSLRSHVSGRIINTYSPDPDSKADDLALLPPAHESLPPETATHGKKPDKAKPASVEAHPPGKGTTHIPVSVHMLGPFSMTIGELPIKLPASRGLSLLKYLLIHRKRHITRDVLMDTFWPDSEPETARNSLDVALHSLRKALRSSTFMPIILYQDGGYIFEPSLQIWLDVDEFERCVQAGQRLDAKHQPSAAVVEYEAAISLYQGDFLEQNPYEEWIIMDRERLRIAYLDTLDRLSHIYYEQEHYAACITVCQIILVRDSCREDTHCILMRCYSRQGQNHLAVRQYHVCKEILRTELGVDPAQQTTKLFQEIIHRKGV